MRDVCLQIKRNMDHASRLQLLHVLFGLSDADLATEFEAALEIGLGSPATLKDILGHLKQTYCSSVGVEFMYCRNEKLRQWLYQKMEPHANRSDFNKDEKVRILHKINEAVHFENFLQTKYVGKKRFSLEGLESLIPALDQLIREGSELGVQEFVLGMAHRGRLNVLVNVF